MPTVDSQKVIAAPVDAVYAIARDIERFPEFMEDVEFVEIVEQTEEKQVSRWGSVIKEFNRTITWTEADYWDDAAKTYEGTWEFAENDEGATVAKLSIEYEYNVPLIGALIQGLVLKKMQANVDSMLAAIKEKAEAQAGQ